MCVWLVTVETSRIMRLFYLLFCSFFSNPSSGVFNRDDSMLASSILLAGLQNSQNSSSTGTTSYPNPYTSQFYDQFQNFLQSAGQQSSSLFSSLFQPTRPPPPNPAPPQVSSLQRHTSRSDDLKVKISGGGDGALLSSVSRLRSGSLGRRYSAPDLQKLGFKAQITTTESMDATDPQNVCISLNTLRQGSTSFNPIFVRLASAQMLMMGDCRGTVVDSVTPNTLRASSTPSSTTQPPTRPSSEAELCQSPRSDGKAESPGSHFNLPCDDDEDTIFVHDPSAIAPATS